MDYDLCKWALSGMATGMCAMALAFWKVLGWWKKESDGRREDAYELSKLLGGQHETKEE